ncbi:rod shape-determining protein MreC [Flammeovirgaceae bacterium SG7u.111]|nr:rod shape-determining protein MreC [Flammeovirgaceae bacterium SG7u.132]WPO35650.1 rod shape-determining protein MreC [Flammeovirgaceae bacterium SG7u.111]
MRQLFLFIYKLRVFFAFVGLELLASWLIVRNNSYQGYTFLSSSNALASNILESKSNINAYFDLKDQNEILALKNAKLEEEKDRLKKQVSIIWNDTSLRTSQSKSLLDTSANYQFTAAKVVNNSVIFNDNYLTIDKGERDGVKPGMGVVSSNGIVGKVKMASKNFATVYSLLHNDLTISSMIKSDSILCTTKWNSAGGDRNDYTTAELLFIPMDHKLKKGDTVITSGYNSVYPEGLMVGVVDTSFKVKSDMFQSVKIKLSTDFSTLRHVYVVENFHTKEIDSLEQETLKTVTY